MITNTNKNVICIKNIPSNLIEEAIFILKSNDVIENEKTRNKRKKIAENEAEIFLNDYINEFSKNDIESDDKKFKKTKIKAIIITALSVIVCYIITRLFI